MKLKNFAMITDDIVSHKLKETPEIFCIADDFSKFLTHRWQNIRLRQKESTSITVKAACDRQLTLF